MSSLRPNQPDDRLFPHPVWLIAHGNVHDLRFVQNALLMAEGFEAPFAVVSAHAAVSDASKGQLRRCQVHHGVIDAAAAKGRITDKFSARLSARSENIAGERFFPILHKALRFVHIFHDKDR